MRYNSTTVQLSTIRTVFLKTGVCPIASTEVLSRVCGSLKQISGEKKVFKSSTDFQSELFGQFSQTKKKDKKTNFDEKSAITQPSCLKDAEDLQRELDVLCNRVAQIKKQLEDATDSKEDEDENLNVMKKVKVTIVNEENSISDMKKSEKKKNTGYSEKKGTFEEEELKESITKTKGKAKRMTASRVRHVGVMTRCISPIISQKEKEAGENYFLKKKMLEEKYE